MKPPTLTRTRLAVRLLISLGFGAVVAAVAVVVAWRLYGKQVQFASEEGQDTYRELRGLERALADHEKETGRIPGSLRELAQFMAPGGPEDEPFSDGWGHPFSYSLQGNRYTIVSLGSDRKQGGKGLESDIILLDHTIQSPDASPTLEQFLFEMKTSLHIRACLGSGLLSALTALVTIRALDGSGGGILALALKLLGVTVAALILVIALVTLEQGWIVR